MQTVLNKAHRFIHSNEQYHLNTEELHIKYNIAPLNISNYYKAQKVWETISENDQYNDMVTPHNNTHNWFLKSSDIIRMDPPQAVVTR